MAHAIDETLAAPMPTPDFDLGDYLDERLHRPSFVMAEIGHGPYPLVANLPRFFSGQRAYIGIEAGMRDRDLAEERAEEFSQQYADANASFLTHDIGEGERLQGNTCTDEWYEGEFEAETILPDAAADEVVASNVFGDPLIAPDFGRTTKLLQEMSRLITHDGLVVVRETITPANAVFLQEYIVKHAGLTILKRVELEEALDWEQLELFYGTHREYANPYQEGSFYLFMGRTAEPGGPAAAPSLSAVPQAEIL
ncbi:MAG TPA: hypothetical protein VHA37_09460 [Candidatus Saccharimonadales bacterium]|nr:hypothetical protein [Candidatus Saccharimonadales bacterium]